MNAMHSSISRRAMLSVAALLLCLGSTEAAPLFVPQKTHAVVIGVLKFRDPGLRSFSAIGRKDKELYELLLKRGVPAKQATLLLDEQATRQGVDKALAQAIGRVKAGETLIVYYAGHGVIYGTGDVAFATYDLTRQNLAGTGLLMSNLSTALARLPKGARVILLADCCYSGRMQRVAREISRLGVESVSLTSADASNYSSGNWTYTQAIIDGLSGAPLADLDNDGQVQLDELAREVKRAMKYRERQKHGFSVHGVKPRLVVSQRKGSALVRGKGPYTIGAYARTKRAGKWETVRIVGRRGPSVQVE
ncbi:MAG: caspase family protein, partial [Myxococcales bacterium]|nr:caspase family protein [Myxococcales bacterium]